ncbi:hypothetical protein F2Q70_00034481 [Brassica cretica]|uniref:Uncharacterized protein n=1 Tax=Brassica cretica TaxID=69181 RepID=A0A8S9JR19_BRACR|nr:hypothetical protein F2Q70_00034481 [Brassica cretica]
MTSFLSLDGKIAAWSSSFQSTPKQRDEAMRVLEGKAFELDVNLEVVQPLTATQLSFTCLYLASANCILSGRSSQSRKHGNIAIQLLIKSAASTSKEYMRKIMRPICQIMIHMLLDMAVDTSESVRPPCRQFGEVLVKFWSLRGLKTFKMMKIGVVAGENHDQMVAAKRRHHCGRPSPDEASRG